MQGVDADPAEDTHARRRVLAAFGDLMTAPAHRRALLRPLKLGFLGLGWFGRQRLQALVEADVAHDVIVADEHLSAAEDAAHAVRGARTVRSFDALLAQDLDGVVIATPSVLHVDQGYQCLDATRAVSDLVYTDALGPIVAVNAVLHSAYGPSSPFSHDRRVAGGGCGLDLGVHLVDLVLAVLGDPAVIEIAAKRFAGGRRLAPGDDTLEDFVTARIELATPATLSLECSWRLQQDGASISGSPSTARRAARRS